jgi:hypothetical protein
MASAVSVFLGGGSCLFKTNPAVYRIFGALVFAKEL